MRLFGFILIAIGIAMIFFREVNFTQEKKVVDLGPIEINKKENKTVHWPTYAGVIILVGGVVMAVMDKKASSK